MRKLTAKEINEITDVFKATLEACSSRTAKVKTAGTSVEVDGQETDLASLPIGTAIACDGGQAFKTSQGWTGTAIPGYFQDDEEAAAELAEESSVRFLCGPSTPPIASVTYEDEDEWFDAVAEDEFIDFGQTALVLNSADSAGGPVIRINGTATYYCEMADYFYNEAGETLSSPSKLARDAARYGFPLSVELFSPYR
nr:MAG TPA: hypothetical protein [Caudoviricetes sp.]